MRGPKPDHEGADALDSFIRSLAAGSPGEAPPASLGRGLSTLARDSVTPGPASEFVERLRRTLAAAGQTAAAMPAKRRHPWLARAAVVSVAAALLAAAATAALIARPGGGRGPQLGAASVLANARDVSASGNVAGVDHFTMTVRSTLLATVDGRVRTVSEIEMRRWVERPDHWRREVEIIRHDAAGNRTGSELVTVSVSDGTTEWDYDNGYRLGAAGVEPSGASLVTKPASPREPFDTALSIGTLSWTTGSASITEVLDTAMSCYSPTLRGTELLIGRKAYVIDLGPSRCQPTPYPVPNNGKAFSFLPTTVWVDAQTFLPLKWEAHAEQVPNMDEVFEIVQLDLDPAIDPARFTYSGPNP